MQIDQWHFPRQELAEQILGMFESGLSSALVFFCSKKDGENRIFV